MLYSNFNKYQLKSAPKARGRGNLHIIHGDYMCHQRAQMKKLVGRSLIEPLFLSKFDKTHFTESRHTSVNKFHGLFLLLVNELATAWPRMTLPPSRRGAKLG